MTAPTDEERLSRISTPAEKILGHFEIMSHAQHPTDHTGEGCEECEAIRSLILSPPKVSVSRERFESACEKFSGHWAGTLDDVRRLGRSILGELGIAVVDSEEGKKQAD